jgi:hypothetical protein
MGRAGSEGDEEVSAPQLKEFAMFPAVTCTTVERRAAISPVDRAIRDFLAGRTDGADLLHALYDHVLDEPVPERLRAVSSPG